MKAMDVAIRTVMAASCISVLLGRIGCASRLRALLDRVRSLKRTLEVVAGVLGRLDRSAEGAVELLLFRRASKHESARLKRGAHPYQEPRGLSEAGTGPSGQRTLGLEPTPGRPPAEERTHTRCRASPTAASPPLLAGRRRACSRLTFSEARARAEPTASAVAKAARRANVLLMTLLLSPMGPRGGDRRAGGPARRPPCRARRGRMPGVGVRTGSPSRYRAAGPAASCGLTL